MLDKCTLITVLNGFHEKPCLVSSEVFGGHSALIIIGSYVVYISAWFYWKMIKSLRLQSLLLWSYVAAE